MDNEIIVDNVDVSSCKSFCENYGEYHQGYWEDNEICYLHNNHCSDNKDCYYKQLLAEQSKNKKLVEALELIMNNDDEPSFENYTATQALLANEVNYFSNFVAGTQKPSREFVFEHITQFPGCTDSSVCIFVKAKEEFTIGDIKITDLEEKYNCVFEDFTDCERIFLDGCPIAPTYTDYETYPWFMNLFFVKYGTKEEN